MVERLPLKYRPEIDGLRAIAVLSVIIYHLKLPVGDGYLFSGGFLGVDIFFVISGYLITHILLDHYHADGRIDLIDFYVRRARRILPPLLMVILFCLACSLLIQLPYEIETFAGSVLAGLGFVSNIFWLFEQSEYGAQSAVLQPLLHLWSLAIEEQFYLIFPFTLMLFGRLRRIGAALGLMLVGSFVIAQLTLAWNANVAFYAPTSRAWELLAGSVLAWATPWTRQWVAQSRWFRFLPILAVTYLIYAFASLELSLIDHPGISTVPVIVATCILILARDSAFGVVSLLASKPMVFCGKLSYSLYLWHFPIFAFGRLTGGDPGPLDIVIWLVLTFGLSYAGYKFVEKPFRFTVPTKAFNRSLVASLGVLAVFCAGAFMTNGYSGRMASVITAYQGNEPNNEVLRDQTWAALDAHTPVGYGGEASASGPSPYEMSGEWFSDDQTCKTLIVGDSHSKDLFNALDVTSQRFPKHQFARFGMTARMSQAHRNALFNSPNFRDADTIVLSYLYIAHDDVPVESLEGFIREIQNQGKTVIVVGNTAQFRTVSGIPYFDWLVRQYKSDIAMSEINSRAFAFQDPDVAEVNARIRAIADRVGALYLARDELVCDAATESCTLSTPTGEKALFDYGHWTLAGAAHFGARAAEAGWFSGADCQPFDVRADAAG